MSNIESFDQNSYITESENEENSSSEKVYEYHEEEYERLIGDL